jgi:hypothetical protein
MLLSRDCATKDHDTLIESRWAIARMYSYKERLIPLPARIDRSKREALPN